MKAMEGDQIEDNMEYSSNSVPVLQHNIECSAPHLLTEVSHAQPYKIGDSWKELHNHHCKSLPL